MKTLIFTAAAVLTFGCVTAQVNPKTQKDTLANKKKTDTIVTNKDKKHAHYTKTDTLHAKKQPAMKINKKQTATPPQPTEPVK